MTEEASQGFVPDILLPIENKINNIYWVITDIETWHKDTIFGDNKNLCLTTNELLDITLKERIQLVWGVFSAVKERPDDLNSISIYDYNKNDYEIDYSDKPKLENAIIEIVFDDASGYLVKSQDKEFYEIYMNYYKDFKLY